MGGLLGVNVMEWNPAVSCDLMELNAANPLYKTRRGYFEILFKVCAICISQSN